MKNRTPAAPNAGAPLPEFAPVPRQTARHDGWTPERQRAFIATLADTGSVSRAAAQVNMTTVGAYQLRRHPQAEGFRAAWNAALDFGVARLKDTAFERAIEGALVPVITGGRLIGYRRIFNDRLLMFCLRHYGEDANGKRTTINYFSTRASAASAASPVSSPAVAGEGDQAQLGGGASSEASTTTVRTTITGNPAATPAATQNASAHLLDNFAGVPSTTPPRPTSAARSRNAPPVTAPSLAPRPTARSCSSPPSSRSNRPSSMLKATAARTASCSARPPPATTSSPPMPSLSSRRSRQTPKTPTAPAPPKCAGPRSTTNKA